MAEASERCPACGAGVPKSARDRAICPECKTVIKVNSLPDADLIDLYSRSWAVTETEMPETGNLTARLAEGFADGLASNMTVDTPVPRVLDYGAGRGAFALECARRGWRVTAFEPFGDMASQPARVVVATEEDEVDGTFDVIAAIEVVEHLRDPAHFAAWSLERLNPGGLLFLTTPNARGLNARATGPRWREFRTSSHLQLFSPAGLRRLLGAAGFDVIGVVDWASAARTVGRRVPQRVLQPLGLGGSLQVLATPRRRERTGDE